MLADILLTEACLFGNILKMLPNKQKRELTKFEPYDTMTKKGGALYAKSK
jgi:hypothetical protein